MSKADIQSQKTKEKLVIFIIIGIVLSTFLATTVFTDLYYYLTMNGSYSIENIYRPNWSFAVASDITSLSGMTLVIGIQMFIIIAFYGSSTPFFPGVVYFVLAWLSVPVMIRITRGISRFKRVFYIYLVCTQLSSPILMYWTGFGA